MPTHPLSPRCLQSSVGHEMYDRRARLFAWTPTLSRLGRASFQTDTMAVAAIMAQATVPTAWAESGVTDLAFLDHVAIAAQATPGVAGMTGGMDGDDAWWLALDAPPEVSTGDGPGAVPGAASAASAAEFLDAAPPDASQEAPPTGAAGPSSSADPSSSWLNEASELTFAYAAAEMRRMLSSNMERVGCFFEHADGIAPVGNWRWLVVAHREGLHVLDWLPRRHWAAAAASPAAN